MNGTPDTTIIGAGPAGLTAAYELAKLGGTSLVLEADEQVGGLSRTCENRGYRFDIGGHRFFTKVDYVRELWTEILGDEFLERPRLSRIFYRGRLFDYPLKPLNALSRLGPLETARIMISYAAAKLRPCPEERSFEQWVTNRFGRRLFQVFFQSYTEKVWGIPCSEISAAWAAQRIKNLDLGAALRSALAGGAWTQRDAVSSLIDRFHYPRLGPGQMWNRCRELVEARGSEVRLRSPVAGIRHRDGRVSGVRLAGVAGRSAEIPVRQLLSSAPLGELLAMFDPLPPREVLQAAARLRYRDFLTVVLVIDSPELLPDNWIYIHAPDVKVGRVQNYKNWSPDMVPDPAKTTLGLEYFVQEGDELWRKTDEELVALGRRECDQLGLAPAAAVEDGVVLRVRKAYPMYQGEYETALRTIREWLDRFSNLQLIGRNGQHRYNNQDHSMMTGILAARNLTGERNDVWSVNVEGEYHEKREEPGAERRLDVRPAHPPIHLEEERRNRCPRKHTA